MKATSRGNPLVPWQKTSSSRNALVCIPWAGAGAAPYRTWAPTVGSQLDLYGVRLGGRESRITEDAPADVAAAVADIIAALETTSYAQFHLLGHCSGAIVAFEVAKALLANCPERVAGLTVIGQVSPRRLTVLEQDAEVERFMTAQVRSDPDLVELLASTIIADTEMLAAYRYLPSPPLTVPITAIRGEFDPELTDEELLHWAEETNSTCAVRVVDGADHLFAGDAWLALAAEALRATGL